MIRTYTAVDGTVSTLALRMSPSPLTTHASSPAELRRRHAMSRARQTGSYKLMLSSNLARREAHGFYERLGFERTSYRFAKPLSG